MPQHTILNTLALKIGYQDTTVAQDIALSLASGTLVGLIGINGAGKSTLLKTLARQITPISGSINLENKNIHTYNPANFSKKVSVVLTSQEFSKNITVQELVALGRHPYTNWLGQLTPQDKQHIRQAIQWMELEDLAAKKCYELSDGQLQRTLIARALAQDTPLILMDEPTTHLDLYHKVHLLKLLQKITHQTRKTILCATHEIELALQLCDELLILKNQTITQGSIPQLMQTTIFEQLFPKELVKFDTTTKRFKIQ